MELSEIIETFQSPISKVKFVDLILRKDWIKENEEVGLEEREKLSQTSLNLIKRGVVTSPWRGSEYKQMDSFWNYYKRLAQWGGLTEEVENTEMKIKNMKDEKTSRLSRYFKQSYNEEDFLQAAYYASEIGLMEECWKCLVKGSRQTVTKNFMWGGMDWSTGLAERVKSKFPKKEKEFYRQAEKEELPKILEFMKVSEAEPIISEKRFKEYLETTRNYIQNYPSGRNRDKMFKEIGEETGCPPEFKQLMVTGAVKLCETEGAYRMSGFLSKCLEDQERANFYEKVTDLF